MLCCLWQLEQLTHSRCILNGHLQCAAMRDIRTHNNEWSQTIKNKGSSIASQWKPPFLRELLRLLWGETFEIMQCIFRENSINHTSIGYCLPSTVCSEPGEELPLPQWRWNCLVLYSPGRAPPCTFIFSSSRLTTTLKTMDILSQIYIAKLSKKHFLCLFT